MIYDQDRGIAAIRYNLLNLPDTIQFTNGNLIIHRYDAAGNRLETKYLTKKIAITVPLEEVVETPVHPQFFYITRDAFHNNIVYTANNTDAYGIEFVHNPEGYIRYYGPEEHYHFYYIKDLLGNIRETYVHPDPEYKECIQRMQYYPSGLPWAEAMVPAEQPWKYNSKEFVEMHGLDEYDSKARWYYPAICRTTTMDPLAEKYYSTSPYAWCGNNPVNAIDPLGLDTIRVTYEEEQWNISDPIIAEGDDVIIVTDEEGNEETITYDEGEYGNRVIALNLNINEQYALGVYHISGVKENGTGFYVTPAAGPSTIKNSGKRIPEDTYDMVAGLGVWKVAGIGKGENYDVTERGIRVHYASNDFNNWKSFSANTQGCFVVNYASPVRNGKFSWIGKSSQKASIYFQRLLGGVDYYYNNRIGAKFQDNKILHKFILKTR